MNGLDVGKIIIISMRNDHLRDVYHIDAFLGIVFAIIRYYKSI